MNSEKTVFAQLLEHAPRYEFDKSVKRYRGHYRHHRFSCYDQFLCLAFAQLTYRESLRDIETCLNSQHEKLYHIGFRGASLPCQPKRWPIFTNNDGKWSFFLNGSNSI